MAKKAKRSQKAAHKMQSGADHLKRVRHNSNVTLVAILVLIYLIVIVIVMAAAG